MSKIVSASKLDRFWERGVLPIKEKADSVGAKVDGALTNYEEVMSNETGGKLIDAIAVKEGFNKLAQEGTGNLVHIDIKYTAEYVGNTFTITNGEETYSKVATESLSLAFDCKNIGDWRITITEISDYSRIVSVEYYGKYSVVIRDDQSAEDSPFISTYDDMMANTIAGYVPDALAVKEGFNQINNRIVNVEVNHNIPRENPKDITTYYRDGSLWQRLNGTGGYSFLEDIFVGDYFQMSRAISAYEITNAYQETGSDWVTIAGINTLMGNGDSTIVNYNHLVMVPGKGHGGLFHFGRSRMNSSHTTSGAYYNSEMNKTTIGAVATSGSTASTATINQQLYAEFTTHLATTRELLTNSTNSSASAAGAGFTGTSNNWAWYDCQAVLMSEIEVYGSNVFSSSGYDTGTACTKLPVFMDKRFVSNRSSYYWLKNVASATNFCLFDYCGFASSTGAGLALIYVRPRFVLKA